MRLRGLAETGILEQLVMHLCLSNVILHNFCPRACVVSQGPDTDQQTVQKIRRVALEAPHEPVQVVILNYKKDGTPFWNLLRVDPIMDHMGQAQAFFGSQTDVTNIIELIDRNMTTTEGVKGKSRTDLFSKVLGLNSLRSRYQRQQSGEEFMQLLPAGGFEKTR